MYSFPAFIAFFLSALILSNSGKAQKLSGSFEYKYSETKYNGSKGNRNNQNSFSCQFLGGLAKELKDGIRIGAKAGITVDKIYSNLFPRSLKNYSKNNILAYLGANIQRRLLADNKKIVSLWITTEIAAEPFISRNSFFSYPFPEDSIPENTLVSFNKVYIDKKARFTITPALKVEIKCTKSISLMVQGGYAIDLGKSNQSIRYFTNRYTVDNYPELFIKDRSKENYLFVGCGLNYIFRKYNKIKNLQEFHKK